MPVKETADLQHIKERHSLADLVEASGVHLRGRGRVRQGRCPFHEEGEASFTVYQDTQKFYCFGCGARGDVLDFVARREGLSLAEAIERLEGPTVPVVPTEPKATPAPRLDAVAPDPTVLTAAARFYAGALWRGREGMAYLATRGIRPRTAMRLGLGYAPGLALREHLAGLGYPSAQLDRSGLFLGHGERFAGKVVVPEISGGRVTWLTGRRTGDGHPRFQALPGAKPLLGLGRLRTRDWLVVTEGVFDWLTLAQWGIPACALLGSHGMERQVGLFGLFQRVYLALDNDPAGKQATEGLRDLLGPRAVPVHLPAGVKDVADLALHPRGRTVFLSLLMETLRSTKTASTESTDPTDTHERRS